MKVYAVSEDDVTYFDSIVECRNWILFDGGKKRKEFESLTEAKTFVEASIR